MRPVTTVPRPEIENTSSIGIKNGWSIGRSDQILAFAAGRPINVVNPDVLVATSARG
jgi:hypothetical protein